MSDKNVNNAGYEKQDVSPAKIIIFGVIGVVVVIAVIGFVAQVFLTTSEDLKKEVVLAPQAAAIRELRAREAEELSSYKVLDSKNGIYQIPIDRAIKLMADEAYRAKNK